MGSTTVKDLKTVVDQLDIGPCGGDLVEAFACLDVLTAKITGAVARFDAAGGWQVDHAANMASWLTARAAVDRRTANRVCAQGRRLRSIPVTMQAWVTGSLSHGQVEAILANLRSETTELFASHEAALVPFLVGLTVKQTGHAMADWAAKATALIEGPEPVEAPQQLRLDKTFNGRWQLTGTFNTEPGSVIETALRLARPDDKTIPNGTANAAALETVCRFYLDNQTTSLGGRHRPHVNVLIDLDQLEGRGQGRLLDGAPISSTAMRRILCDAKIHRVITVGPSTILDYGRSTRTIPPALFTALVLRDKHCRMPGCEQPPERCDVHHVIPWEQGGSTNLRNTILICPFDHHNKCHGNGWHLEMEPDGTLHITDPNGTRHTTHPPGTRGAALISATR